MSKSLTEKDVTEESKASSIKDELGYKRGCLSKASNFLIQTFPLALGLNHLAHLRETLYLFSLVNSSLSSSLSTNSDPTR